ncbi:DUF2986 domain-containing protein [Vibrio sp. S11_S32]|nr:DUF2986 domain-containing protein [Vibrio sp. S11_S32]MBD1576614.1 DUF2986 domain-containing protein [Vibrio sp. S11_S32]
MNRKKKINSILKKRIKKMNSKLHTSNKPKYVSKADREKLVLEAQQQNDQQVDAQQQSEQEQIEQE